MTTVGNALIEMLEAHGVEVVFGIPGVHTIEIYRGLAASNIRHVTPRHEQGAGFMADGYARVSGKPGVAFVITGPGLTNTLTPMAQARADSVPMLVVSGVNATDTLGLGLGYLHELTDQQATAATVALVSKHVGCQNDLKDAVDSLFSLLKRGRPGPTHLQIPLDVAGDVAEDLARDVAGQQASSSSISVQHSEVEAVPDPDAQLVSRATTLLSEAKRPVILAGGGARNTGHALKHLAEQLDAPVVQTVNARGVLFEHPLSVPASPSLNAIRSLIEEADVVLAIGTELGPTDYDMYATGKIAKMSSLIRVDICPDQLKRHSAAITIQADAARTIEVLTALLQSVPKSCAGSERAAKARQASHEEIGPYYRHELSLLNALRDAVPQAIFVGDSTQAIYVGNLYYDHDRPGGWFNAATGYGALGYGIPAAIGASIAAPGERVVAILGDGSAQFSLPDIMVAAEENLPISFVIWNNQGYVEIAQSMRDAGSQVLGCDPRPPDFEAIARAYGIPFMTCAHKPGAVAAALKTLIEADGPCLIEITAPAFEAEA